jgi:hypothetical protein
VFTPVPSMPIVPLPLLAFRNGSVAAVFDDGRAAAYTGTRSAGPAAGVTVTRPEASLSQCRGRMIAGAVAVAATAVWTSGTVASRVFSIGPALAVSRTRNVPLPAAGTVSDVPSGNEYATPGIDVRAS